MQQGAKRNIGMPKSKDLGGYIIRRSDVKKMIKERDMGSARKGQEEEGGYEEIHTRGDQLERREFWDSNGVMGERSSGVFKMCLKRNPIK